jgi:hypothetical protein
MLVTLQSPLGTTLVTARSVRVLPVAIPVAADAPEYM